MLFCCILYVMAVYFVLYLIKSVSLVLSFANVFFSCLHLSNNCYFFILTFSE
jgi:hypothetical protein